MDTWHGSKGAQADPSVLVAAFDQLVVAAAVIDRSGQVVQANRAMTAMLGDLRDWTSFPPVVREVALGENGGFDGNRGLETMLRPNLRVRWTILGIDGHGWLAQAENVTALAMTASLREENRLSDQRLAALAELNRIVERTDFDNEVSATVELIAERARSLLDTSGLAIGQVDGEELVYNFAAGTPELLRLRGLRVPLRASLTGIAFRSGHAEVCEDAQTDPRVDQNATRAAKIRSMICVPMRQEGRITAIVTVFSEEPHSFQPSDVQTIELIAGVISQVYGHAADLASKRALLAELQAGVEALRASEARLARALYDPLTRLPNRVFFVDRLAQALATSALHQGLVGVILVDVDHFKQINDQRGHSTGDMLLCEMANRLVNCLQGSEIAARMGGDEFAVLCEGLTSPDELVRLAERASLATSQPIQLAGTTFQPTVSIGAAVGGGKSDSANRILRAADDAAYEAKRRGRARIQMAS